MNTPELVPINELKPDPKNARRHGARNMAAIKAALERFGQQKPIVADRDGTVRAGNGTLAAALELGWKEIMVVYTDLSPGEARAYALADNRTAELAEWDPDDLLAELGALEAEGITTEGLEFDPAKPDEPVKIKEVEVSEVHDRFWLSVTGPLPKQPEAIAALQAALEKIEGVEVLVGTTQDA